jgi:hypothetical protein
VIVPVEVACATVTAWFVAALTGPTSTTSDTREASAARMSVRTLFS